MKTEPKAKAVVNDEFILKNFEHTRTLLFLSSSSSHPPPPPPLRVDTVTAVSHALYHSLRPQLWATAEKHYGELTARPQSLRFELERAAAGSLPDKDAGKDVSDPYFRLVDSGTHVRLYQSTVIDNCLNPRWSKEQLGSAAFHSASNALVLLQFFDKDTIGHDDFLAEAQLDLALVAALALDAAERRAGGGGGMVTVTVEDFLSYNETKRDRHGHAHSKTHKPPTDATTGTTTARPSYALTFRVDH